MTMIHRLARTHRGLARGRRRRFAPRIDVLETRALLSTLVVNSAGDGTSTGPGTLTLRQAVADAAPGDTITFAHSLRGQTITLTQGVIPIAEDLTIVGPGADQLSVSGDDSSEIFGVAARVTVTISGLTITDGLANQGGGIENAGTLTLQGDAVSGNEAGPSFAEGGGIYNSGTLSLADTTVSGNQASGFLAEGGGIYNSGTLTIAGSKVTDNLATSSDAGGGGIMNDFGTVDLERSTISGNTALGTASTVLGGFAFGGGIENIPASQLTATGIPPGVAPSLKIVASTFVGNVAQGGAVQGTASGGAADGGAISNDGGALETIADSVFRQNSAVGGSGGFAGAGYGGAISSGGMVLQITQTTFLDNQAAGGAGGNGAFIPAGGSAFGGAIDSGGDALTIAGSSFQGNTAVGGEAGAGSLFGTPGANADGGALDYFGGTAVIDGVPMPNSLALSADAFSGNQAVGGTGQGFDGGAGSGGGLYIDLSDVPTTVATIAQITVNGNVAQGGTDATGGAGGSAVGGGLTFLGAGSLTVAGSTITGNQSIGGAGYGGSGGVQFDGGGLAQGGGIADSGGSISLGSTLVGNNEAIGGAGGGGGNGGAGGGAEGGGLYIQGMSGLQYSDTGSTVEVPLPATVTMTNGFLTGNAARGGGGGAGTSGGNGGGGGAALGGGLFSYGALVVNEDYSTGVITTSVATASVTITNEAVLGNQAQGGAGGTGDGSGAGGAGGNALGGAADNNAASTFEAASVLFSLNSAVGGAGGAGGSSGAGGAGGQGFGGAVYNAGPIDDYYATLPGGTLSLSSSLVIGNLAQGGKAGSGVTDDAGGQGIGGGLYLAVGSTTTLTNTVVAANRASTSNDDIYGTYDS